MKATPNPIPFSADVKSVRLRAIVLATKSAKDVFQYLYCTDTGGRILITDTMITAARVALGIQNIAPFKEKMPRSTMPVVNIPPRGLLTPDSEFTDVREMAPPTGMPPNIPFRRLVTPRKTSSWLSSMVYPFLRPNDFAIATCSKAVAMKTGKLK